MKQTPARRKISPAYLSGMLLLVLFGGSHASAQAAPPVPDGSDVGLQRHKEPESPWALQQQREMAKKRNEARQQDIKKDTDKLLDLATELKQYVDKTNENILSMDVVKKADEIEKLAKSVKEKMKGP